MAPSAHVDPGATIGPSCHIGAFVSVGDGAAMAWQELLVPVAPTGPVYAVGAVLLGAMFLTETYKLLGRAKAGVAQIQPMRVFHWSITYLTLLFVLVAVDPFVRF